MAYSTLMNILDAADELLVHSNCSLLVKPLVANDVVEELAVLAVLHYQEQLRLGLDDLVQLNHVGVTDFLKDFDLSAYSLDVFLVLDPRLLKNLDGHLLVGQVVRGKLHFAKGALAK